MWANPQQTLQEQRQWQQQPGAAPSRRRLTLGATTRHSAPLHGRIPAVVSHSSEQISSRALQPHITCRASWQAGVGRSRFNARRDVGACALPDGRVHGGARQGPGRDDEGRRTWGGSGSRSSSSSGGSGTQPYRSGTGRGDGDRGTAVRSGRGTGAAGSPSPPPPTSSTTTPPLQPTPATGAPAPPAAPPPVAPGPLQQAPARTPLPKLPRWRNPAPYPASLQEEAGIYTQPNGPGLAGSSSSSSSSTVKGSRGRGGAGPLSRLLQRQGRPATTVPSVRGPRGEGWDVEGAHSGTAQQGPQPTERHGDWALPEGSQVGPPGPEGSSSFRFLLHEVGLWPGAVRQAVERHVPEAGRARGPGAGGTGSEAGGGQRFLHDFRASGTAAEPGAGAGAGVAAGSGAGAKAGAGAGTGMLAPASAEGPGRGSWSAEATSPAAAAADRAAGAVTGDGGGDWDGESAALTSGPLRRKGTPGLGEGQGAGPWGPAPAAEQPSVQETRTAGNRGVDTSSEVGVKDAGRSGRGGQAAADPVLAAAEAAAAVPQALPADVASDLAAWQEAIFGGEPNPGEREHQPVGGGHMPLTDAVASTAGQDDVTATGPAGHGARRAGGRAQAAASGGTVTDFGMLDRGAAAAAATVAVAAGQGSTGVAASGVDANVLNGGLASGARKDADGVFDGTDGEREEGTEEGGEGTDGALMGAEVAADVAAENGHVAPVAGTAVRQKRQRYDYRLWLDPAKTPRELAGLVTEALSRHAVVLSELPPGPGQPGEVLAALEALAAARESLLMRQQAAPEQEGHGVVEPAAGRSGSARGGRGRAGGRGRGRGRGKAVVSEEENNAVGVAVENLAVQVLQPKQPYVASSGGRGRGGGVGWARGSMGRGRQRGYASRGSDDEDALDSDVEEGEEGQGRGSTDPTGRVLRLYVHRVPYPYGGPGVRLVPAVELEVPAGGSAAGTGGRPGATERALAKRLGPLLLSEGYVALRLAPGPGSALTALAVLIHCRSWLAAHSRKQQLQQAITHGGQQHQQQQDPLDLCFLPEWASETGRGRARMRRLRLVVRLCEGGRPDLPLVGEDELVGPVTGATV